MFCLCFTWLAGASHAPIFAHGWDIRRALSPWHTWAVPDDHTANNSNANTNDHTTNAAPAASGGSAQRPPLIGITGRRREGQLIKDFPKPLQGCLLDTYITDYSESVAAAGGLPVLLTPDADVAPLLERLDGVLLSGGADIEPQRYGAQTEPECGPVEPERDEFELAIYERVVAMQIPLLGVCRGLQLVNVGSGGTLHQHVPDHTVGKQPAHTEIHEVKIEPGTTLATIYNTESRGVNSLHHQALDRVAEGLLVSARSDDGYVEGVEHPSLPVVAVQWHPELMKDAKNDPLFAWLVAAARMWAAEKL